MYAARGRKHEPSESNVSGFAPYLRSRITMGRWPCLVVQWMGVEASSPPATLGFAPFCRERGLWGRARKERTLTHLNQVGGNSNAVINGCPVKNSNVLTVSLRDVLPTHLHKMSAPTHRLSLLLLLTHNDTYLSRLPYCAASTRENESGSTFFSPSPSSTGSGAELC